MNTAQPSLLVSGAKRSHRRLNIGCGDVQPRGWVNADAEPVGEAVLAELGGTDPLPWGDETFDFAVAHHVLGYVSYDRLMPALGELRRVLVDGGIVRFSVPNLIAGVRAHARGDIDWFPAIVGDETSLDGRFLTWVTWYSTHCTVFSAPWLCELCVRAGFGIALPAACGYSPLGGDLDGICDLDDRCIESAYVEARR